MSNNAPDYFLVALLANQANQNAAYVAQNQYDAAIINGLIARGMSPYQAQAELQVYHRMRAAAYPGPRHRPSLWITVGIPAALVFVAIMSFVSAGDSGSPDLGIEIGVWLLFGALMFVVNWIIALVCAIRRRRPDRRAIEQKKTIDARVAFHQRYGIHV